MLEQIKGISEQKATKILAEGKPTPPTQCPSPLTRQSISVQTRPYGLHHRNGNAPTPLRTHLHHHRLQTTRYPPSRRRRNRLRHRNLRRIPHGEIPNLPHTSRNMPTPLRHGRRRRKMPLHRHRRHLPPRPLAQRSKPLRTIGRRSLRQRRLRPRLQLRPPAPTAEPSLEHDVRNPLLPPHRRQRHLPLPHRLRRPRRALLAPNPPR